MTATTPRIGPHQLGGRVLLAPMAGITDMPFRKICREWGASLAASEMTTANTGLWETKKSARRLAGGDEPGPRVVQIAGSEPAQIADAARMAVDRGADIVDINMGCPAKKVCKRLAGSALLRDEDLVQRILEAAVNAVSVPVTLKMRTGWDPDHRNGVRIARIAQDQGIQAIAVHGRTRACAYRGEAEYETIRAIKESVRIPVFANGDVTDGPKAAAVLQSTGADAIMIGRAARGQPWLFRQLDDYLEKKVLTAQPALATRRDIILAHLEAMHRFYGETGGVRVARKHLAWYAEHLEDGASFRSLAVSVDSSGAQLQITREFFARREQGENAAAG